MARLPRLTAPGYPQHIIQRGNNRQACFFAVQDYAVYLNKLKEAAEKHNVEIHAYVLMTNHVHLLMTPKQRDAISKVMQNLGRYYVRYINNNYHRSGTLWEGRFKSTIVADERYLLTLYRYIELNPVRAKMVENPADYPWSSYHMNAGNKSISLITPHPLYTALGESNETRKAAYQAMFKIELPRQALQNVRNATNKGWVLGDEKFKTQVEKALNRRSTPLKQGGDRRSKEFLEKRQFQRT